MRILVSIVFSIMILIGIIGISESFAEDNRNMIHLEKKGIIITFSTDKSSYSPQEPIHITYQIKNQGEDGINYHKIDSCADGFVGYLLNQDEKYYFQRFLSAGIYLMPENNPLGKKIDDTFYGELLLMIKNNETRDYGIIVYGDKKRISTVLQDKHNASSINEATRLSFVTAKVPVNEILKIAKYSFVHSIGDGEKKYCAQAVTRGTLVPGEGFEKSFYLSQEFYRWPGVHTLPLGNYEIVLNFRLLDEKILPAGSEYGGSPKAENIESLTLKLPITISNEPPNVDAHVKLISKEKSTTVSPRQQITNGISPENIICNPEFYLVFKATDNSPACVKPTTVEKLIERGWTTSQLHYKEIQYFDANFLLEQDNVVINNFDLVQCEKNDLLWPRTDIPFKQANWLPQGFKAKNFSYDEVSQIIRFSYSSGNCDENFGVNNGAITVRLESYVSKENLSLTAQEYEDYVNKNLQEMSAENPEIVNKTKAFRISGNYAAGHEADKVLEEIVSANGTIIGYDTKYWRPASLHFYDNESTYHIISGYYELKDLVRIAESFR